VKSPLRQNGCGKLPVGIGGTIGTDNTLKLLEKSTSATGPGEQSGRVALPLAVAWVLAAALLLRVGLLLWEGVSSEPASGSAAAEAPATARQPDLAALQALHLFASGSGLAATSAAMPTLNTALNLHLEGVMLAGAGGDSRAVILSGDRRGSYRAGDTLPAGANITVESIASDHVVIDNRGQREVLWLFTGRKSGTDAAAAAVTGNPGLVLPPGTDARVVKTAARLAEIISVAPEVVNGQVVGYRLTPGARLKDFVQLGFQTNDIVTAVNGLALNDVGNLPQLYSLMDGATEVSFSLLRAGAPLNLKVTLAPETPVN
jgi:general secretion pathway protein C